MPRLLTLRRDVLHSKIRFQYPVSYMHWALITLLSLLPVQYLSDIQVTPLGFKGEPFKQIFNRDQALPRLVAVFSPT